MTTPTENIARAAGAEIAVIRGGSGKPLLILHDELGYPGWMTWNETSGVRTHAADSAAARLRQDTERIDWIRNYRDLAGFYSQVRARDETRADRRDRFLGRRIHRRGDGWPPTRGFSRRMVLVAPMGIKAEHGEICDIFAVTIRTHLLATVADPAKTPEFTKLYGGEMTPEQFEAFEDARAETARIGWEPFMHNPSLPHLLRGVKTPTLLVWGTRDRCRAARMYRRVHEGDSRRAGRADRWRGHRPEIENPAEFDRVVRKFLAA